MLRLNAGDNIPSVRPTKDKKKTRWLRLLFLFVCIFAVVASILMVRVQPPKAAQSVQVITSDWDPYVDTTADNGGIIGDMVTSVLGSSGYNANVAFDNWSPGLDKVERGTAFGIFPMVKSAEREEIFEYSDPLVNFQYVLFARSGHEVSEAVKNGDFSGVRVGKIDGYDYWPELENSGAQFTTYPSTIAGFSALADGEVDLLAESDIVGQAALESAKYTGDANSFTIVEGDNPALSSQDSVHFLVRKSSVSREMMDNFNRALADYKNTERYREQVDALSGSPDRVTLSGDGLIEVTDASGASLGAVPPGVTARVIEWPEDLTEESRVEIKMLDGPLAGRLGFVQLENVEVTRADS